MTNKRMKKLMMSRGVPRDTADFISKHIKLYDANGNRYSNEFMLNNVTVEVHKK